MSKNAVYFSKDFFPANFGMIFTKKAWDKEVKELGFPEEEWPEDFGKMATSYFKPDGENPTILVSIHLSDEELDNIPYVYSCLIHEAVHVKQCLFDYIKENKPGREIEAYVVEHCAKALIQQFEEWRNND